MITTLALQAVKQRSHTAGFWALLALLFALLGLLFLGLMEEFIRTIQPTNLQREQPVSVSDGLILPYFWWCGIILPALMPLLASQATLADQQQASDMLYRLSPIRNHVLISGRLLGLLMIQTLIVLAVSIPPLLFSNVAILDWGQLISSIVGLSLITLQASALALYFSLRIPNILGALLASYATLLLLGMLYLLGNLRGSSGELFFQLSSFTHYRPWLEARFEFRHLSYFLLSALMFFLLSIQAYSFRDTRHASLG